MAKKKQKLNIDCSYDKLVPVKDLRPNPGNPNKHTQQQIELLAAIIKATKWRYPITVSKQSGLIVTGHCRYEASKHLGLDAVPVSFQSFDSNADELAELARENKIREYAEIDGQMMADLLVELDQANYDLNLVAMTPDEIQDYVLGPLEPKPEDDIVPDPPKKAITKTGDLWLLGDHRVLCGDCTVSANVGRLMGQDKADMVFTDPPYGIGVVSKQGSIGKGVICQEGHYRPITGDDKPFDPTHLFVISERVFLFGANYYAQRLPEGGRWMVWDKNRTGNTTFSDCEIMWASDDGIAIKKYEFTWVGMIQEGQREKRVHPTQKPVGLLLKIFDDFRFNHCVDVYLGSGSTLIACEKLNRRCYGMEIDPLYVDVCVERWEKFTGKKAKRQKAAA